MKVIITGGAGYIGSHTIVEMLEHTSFEPISIDSFVHSSESTFDRIKDVTGVVVENHNVDVCNPFGIAEVFAKYNDIVGVIHCAALKSVPESVKDPELYHFNNIESTRNVLECMRKFGVKNLIFSSSCSVYGNINKDNLPVNEDTPIGKAESPYGRTKQKCETLIKLYAKETPDKINAISLRYFNPVGAHMTGLIGEIPIGKPNNIVPAIIRGLADKTGRKFQVFGSDYDTRDGTCIRDYIHVSDIANAHILALQYLVDGKNASGHDVINLGSGNGVTVLEAIGALEKASGTILEYKLSKRRQGDIEAIYSDSSKSEKLLSWKSKYNTEQMMDSAWKWHLQYSKTSTLC